MRRILIETTKPWRFPGYMVVGGHEIAAPRKDQRSGVYRTKLRLVSKIIDHPVRMDQRKEDLIRIDPHATIGISEVRPCS